MCLRKSHWLPKINTKPVKAYKVLIRGNDMYRTPYTHTCVKIGDTIKAKQHWFGCLLSKEIRGEGIHAFTKWGNCINEFLQWQLFYNACVVEVEIPPFTPYWVGLNNDIAASRMRIKKILDFSYRHE